MHIRKTLARREEIRSELRGLLASADGALTPEAEARAAALELEAETLNTAERRGALLADLDQRAEAAPVEDRGEPISVFGLKPEQRIAQFVEATTGERTAGLSVGRTIAGMITGRWTEAESERRVMSSTTGSTGGFLVPAPIAANVIDLARNESVMIRAGAMTIPMPGQTLAVAQVLADPTASWRGEGAAIPESDGAFGLLNLRAHSLAALVRTSNELLDDVPTFAATLDQQLAAALALKLDHAALFGTGAGMPQGLRANSSLQEISMGANGAALTDYDDILDLIQAVEEANGTPAVAIMAPRTKTKLAKLVTGISGDLTKLAPPPEYSALRQLVSNQVSVTETQGSSNAASTMFVGGFENVALAIRQDITIEISRQADDTFAKNQSLVRAILRADVAVLRPALLGRLIGVL